MEIPTVNIIAVFHLASVSCLIGVIFAEIVVERASVIKKDLLPETIRFHYWIDLFVEIPIGTCVVVTGVLMALWVPEITNLHIVKIGCAGTGLLLGNFCIFKTIKRHRMFKNGLPEQDLFAITGKIHITAAIIYLFLIAIISIGSYLAYHRILEMIY